MFALAYDTEKTWYTSLMYTSKLCKGDGNTPVDMDSNLEEKLNLVQGSARLHPGHILAHQQLTHRFI